MHFWQKKNSDFLPEGFAAVASADRQAHNNDVASSGPVHLLLPKNLKHYQQKGRQSRSGQR